MIKILKSIYSILSNDVEVSSIVSDKIFPDVVPDMDNTNDNIDYPLIVMRRSEVLVEYSKSCNSDTAAVDIFCYSNSYFQAIDMAESIRAALENYKGDVEGITINDARIISISEDYVENVYYQQISFEIR